MRKIRVLYLSSWPVGARGEGAASFVYEQVNALADVVDAFYIEHAFSDALSWARKRASGRDVESLGDLWRDHVSAARIFTPRLPPRLTGREVLDDVSHAGTMVSTRVVNSFGNIDLVHAHVVLPAGLLGAAVAEALHAPLIVQEHSSPFSMHTDTAAKRAAVARTFSSARCVCAVGDALAADISREFKGVAVSVLPNLVLTTLFAPAPSPNRDSLRIVSVGSLEVRKGFDTLLEAVSIVQAKGQPVQLRIVGTGALRDNIERELIRCNQDPASVLSGQLTRREVVGEIERAHIYVCSSRAETFGIAAAEALSVGRPVVTTRCGGPESFVDSTCGEVVNANDPTNMADAILRTWNRLDDFDPVRLHATVEAKFGNEAFRDRVLALYSEIVGTRVAA